MKKMIPGWTQWDGTSQFSILFWLDRKREINEVSGRSEGKALKSQNTFYSEVTNMLNCRFNRTWNCLKLHFITICVDCIRYKMKRLSCVIRTFFMTNCNFVSSSRHYSRLKNSEDLDLKQHADRVSKHYV